jgi:putative endonuclease
MIGKGGYVYIVSNKNRTVLYTGVTSNLAQRIWEHKNGEGSSFTKKYNCVDILFYEFFDTIEEAIQREKNIKKYKRSWKENLITSNNPEMLDLHDQIGEMN